MFDSVTVAAAARLHLGFLDMNGGLGRRFGGLGLAIDRPATRLTIRRAAAPAVEGLEAERAARHLALLTRHLGLTPAYRLTIHEAIPAHAGLGSGTQLALAIATALRRLEGLSPDYSNDALLLRRGARSGIGLGLFQRGGLIVDGGRGARTVDAARRRPHGFPAAMAGDCRPRPANRRHARPRRTGRLRATGGFRSRVGRGNLPA